jgi:hypothetical protein
MSQMKKLPVWRFISTASLTTFIHIDAVIGPDIMTAPLRFNYFFLNTEVSG